MFNLHCISIFDWICEKGPFTPIQFTKFHDILTVLHFVTRAITMYYINGKLHMGQDLVPFLLASYITTSQSKVVFAKLFSHLTSLFTVWLMLYLCYHLLLLYVKCFVENFLQYHYDIVILRFYHPLLNYSLPS